MSRRAEEPAPLDPAGVVRAFEQHRVRYVVIGGVAAQLHGSPVRTRGFDVTPERSAPNLARLAAALASIEAREWVPGFGYPLQLPMDRRRLAGDRVLFTQTRHGRVDVVPTPHGLPGGYDMLKPRAPLVTAYGAELPVASLDDLACSHAAASRSKDRLALTRLIDLKLRIRDRPLPPHILQSAESPAAPTLHDALAASQRLAVVFDVIRPQLAYVRRELYRAVDNVMYGDEASTRDAVDRAHHAASNVHADVQRLQDPIARRSDGKFSVAPSREEAAAESLSLGAEQELRATIRLLASAASRHAPPNGDALRDVLIEARVHAATADNHLDQLQIRLEHVARRWEGERPARGDSFRGD
jgi:hypothetical protein